MNTLGPKKLIYLAFPTVNSTEKVVSSYAQHFPTLLESRFGKKIFDPWRAADWGPRGSKNQKCQFLLKKPFFYMFDGQGSIFTLWEVAQSIPGCKKQGYMF